MNRKRFQSHWKELLAIRESAEDPQAKPDAVPADDEARLVPQLVRTGLQSLHRHRYGWLAATCAVLALCLLAVHGSSDGRPDRVSVSGQVLFDGRPLTRGTILFVPPGARPSAAAVGTDGRFRLTCYAGQDGAVPGVHRLALAPGGVAGQEDDPWPVPARYADYQTSGLSVEITGATADLVLQLTGDHPEPRDGPDPAPSGPPPQRR
jgi:hypothetical protein